MIFIEHLLTKVIVLYLFIRDFLKWEVLISGTDFGNSRPYHFKRVDCSFAWRANFNQIFDDARYEKKVSFGTQPIHDLIVMLNVCSCDWLVVCVKSA